MRGSAEGGQAVFLGIPYAAPPFGARRFREPGPVAAWSGVRECVRYGPIAPQSAELPGAPVWVPGREDILSLNVWSPADTASGAADASGAAAPGVRPLPVLFWIHGGGYVYGSSAQPDYDGAALARAGLVVVSCNYRVGFEGFGHVPGFPANRGLLDQIAALRWVRENIAAFGGDPGNVTVAGQSAGAGSVVSLMAMAGAAGLFRRAVAHSVPVACFSRDLAAGLAGRVAREAGVPATAEGLLSASPAALVEASDRVVAGFRADPGAGALYYDPHIYAPVVDGATLPVDPLTALAGGSAAGPGSAVDLLMCHTTEEYWLMRETGGMPPVTTEKALLRFTEDYGLPPELAAGQSALMPGAAVEDVYLALAGAAVFTTHSARLARAHAGAGGRTYLSRFDRRRTRADGTPVRAWHAGDVPFVFGNLDAGVEFLTGGPVDAADRALSGRMVRAWAAFAATGDPGWAPLDAGGGGTAHVWGVPGDRTECAETAEDVLWRGVYLPTPRC